MVAEQAGSMEHNLKVVAVVVVDLLLAECMLFVVEAERMAEQLAAVDTVPDTAV